MKRRIAIHTGPPEFGGRKLKLLQPVEPTGSSPLHTPQRTDTRFHAHHKFWHCIAQAARDDG